MSRRSKHSILEDLFELPWWVSVVFAAIVYLLLRFAAPAFFSSHPVTAGIGKAGAELAWMFGVVFLLVTPFAALRQYQRKRLLDAHADINSIRNLSWKDFEKLVAEAFHRQGYWVAEKGGANADGGIDIVLKRADERVLVQCKHWRTRMVGVAKVRELYGVMTAEHATRAVLVTSGSFSEDAIAFASGKPLELIDGPQLEDLVRTVRTSAPKTTAVQTASTALGCPECGGKMVRRTAKKGIMAGSSFWGCSRYPSCHGLRQIA